MLFLNQVHSDSVFVVLYYFSLVTRIDNPWLLSCYIIPISIQYKLKNDTNTYVDVGVIEGIKVPSARVKPFFEHNQERPRWIYSLTIPEARGWGGPGPGGPKFRLRAEADVFQDVSGRNRRQTLWMVEQFVFFSPIDESEKNRRQIQPISSLKYSWVFSTLLSWCDY